MGYNARGAVGLSGRHIWHGILHMEGRGTIMMVRGEGKQGIEEYGFDADDVLLNASTQAWDLFVIWEIYWECLIACLFDT